MPFATLTAGFVEFNNLDESKGLIRTSFLKQRGVYLWTNKTNGNQYIGSAMDLSSRLSDYFTNSYLNFQSTRGSAISSAILKHGFSDFKLQVLVLGPSPVREDISVNSDFILLEQYYLDRYVLKYNIRRIALGAAPISKTNSSKVKGKNNPQFEKYGTEEIAWSNKHSEEQKALWSLTRSTPIFIYDAINLSFKLLICGYERLANYLGVHVNTAKRAAKSANSYTSPKGDNLIISLVELTDEDLKTIKVNDKPRRTVARSVHVYNKNRTVLLKSFPTVNSFMNFSNQNGSSVKFLCESDKLWLDEYFLSACRRSRRRIDLKPSADNSLSNVREFEPELKDRKASIPVYTYSADGKTFIKRYSSLRDCVKELEGNRNFNTKTLELRIKYKELYHGFIVSNTPLFDYPL